MNLLWLISCLLLCYAALCQAQSSAQLRGNQERNAFDITRSLYSTLRNIAFPQNKLSDKPGVENRFLLLTPGQVLNYFDFFPGEEYVRFIQEYQGKNKETVVPPHVMEKWFDIADGIPSPDIMNGQITGKSLSTIYSTILYGIKIKGFEAKAESQLASYKQARNFLLEPVLDPESLGIRYNTTRLGLYERYRDEYNDKKLNMEDEIESVRRNFGSEDYELWFQRHYPSLNSKVESAYTKWMVFGQKELVEFYIAFMDRGSPEKLVEDARASLRASGVISLDRTRTIYPVSFDPSDWYQYILPEPQTFSRDQLLQVLGKVKSKLNVITSMIDVINGLDANSPIGMAAQKLNIALNNSRSNAKKQLNQHLDKKYQCMANSSTCSGFHDSEESTIEALVNETKIFALRGANVYTSKSEYLEHLQSEKTQLEREERNIDATLRVTSPYLGEILNADELLIANLTAASRADNWLEFSYDSSSHSEQTDEEQTQNSVARHFGGGFLFFSFQSSYSTSKSTQDLNHHVAQSQIKVKGKLLRVHIKRPWFKPSVFLNPDLSFYEGGGGTTTYVAPGTELTETQFYRRITDNKVRYLLPEYTTGFLLARDIEIEFKGLDSSIVTHAMQSSLHSSTSGGFLFFHFGSSVSKSKHKSHTAISRTADGMSIKIPGAQIIGYYTQKLPQFPAQQ